MQSSHPNHITPFSNTKAISAADGEDAAKWIGVQDKLLKQILTLGETLGLTAEKRKAMGWTLPG